MAKKKPVSKHKAKRAAAPADDAKAGPKPPGPAGTRPLKGLLTRKIREAQARKLLLFVSTGNTCRSPMAAAYLKKLLDERKVRSIEVRSAGVMTIAGLLSTDESKQMLEPYNVSLDRHRSQPLTEEMLRRADLVLGMTPFHVQMSLRLLDSARDKMHLLKEYTKTDPKNRPIPDPMGCTLEVYKKCFRQIKIACDRLIDMPFVTGKAVKAPRSATATREHVAAGSVPRKSEPAPVPAEARALRAVKQSAVRSKSTTQAPTPSSARPSRASRTVAQKG